MSGKQGGGFSKTVKSGNTQVIVQKKQGKKPTEQKPKPAQQEFKPFGKGGVIIGEDDSDEKWRCAVCSFLNDLNA